MPIRKNGTTAVDKPQAQQTQPAAEQPAQGQLSPVTHEPADPQQRRISRAGLYQAALQSQGVMVHNSKDFQTYLDGVRRAAEEGLRWIND
jgi:phosphatidylserine/phosphatidylglycerophosphate/cardiolipin synthase-like enzyme